MLQVQKDQTSNQRMPGNLPVHRDQQIFQEEGLILKTNKEEALYVEEHTFDQDLYESDYIP